jgi:large subunit ribosomal protein L31
VKKDIHPTWYPEAKVVCACGNAWTTGSTVKEIRVDVCSKCHPFFTGQQRIVDTAGQVERFTRKVETAQKLREEAKEREKARREREKSRQLVELVDEDEEVSSLEDLLEEQAEENTAG